MIADENLEMEETMREDIDNRWEKENIVSNYKKHV